jgi:hypothetical protein
MQHRTLLVLGVAVALLGAVTAAHPARAIPPTYGPCCINVTVISRSEIDFGWREVSADQGVTGYRIQRESPIGNGFVTIVSDTNNTYALNYKDTGLLPNTTYSYRVAAINRDGVGEFSTVLAAATTSVIAVVQQPDPPKLIATALSGSQVALSWTAPQNVSDALSYKVERESPIGGGFTTVVASTTATTYQDGNLSPSVTYNYRVTATDAAYGRGKPSPGVVVTMPTPPDAPRNVRAVAGDGRATISWLPPLVPGGTLTGYVVAGNPTSSASVAGTASSTTITGLTNGTSYSWNVSAVNLAGQGPPVTSNTIVPTAAPPTQPTSTATSTTPTSTPATATPSPAATATTAPDIQALRNQLNTLLAALQALQAQAAQQSAAAQINNTAATARPTFSVDRGIGSSGDDVTALQNFLISRNAGAAARALAANGATRYFGPLTKAALLEFQKSVGIAGANGRLGPATRAYINVLPH